MICAMDPKVLLSFIFVPALSVLFVLALVVIVMKRSKPDTMVVLMYELKLTRESLKEETLTQKQLKMLDLRLSKLQMLADKAGYEDEYDVGIVQSAFDEGRKISAALYAANRERCGAYLKRIDEKLAPAADYLSNSTGINLDDAHADFKLFSASAKRDRAEKYLDSLSDRQN